MKEKIFDPLRKKYVALTPEEQVRQMVITWLNRTLGFSLNLMMSEYSFKYNGLNYRADIVVFNRDMSIKMLVECKAPSVKIDSEVIDQGIRYNRVLGVQYILFANGISMCGYKRDDISNEYHPIKDVKDIV